MCNCRTSLRCFIHSGWRRCRSLLKKDYRWLQPNQRLNIGATKITYDRKCIAASAEGAAPDECVAVTH